MDSELYVKGGRELAQALRELPDRLEANVLRGALRAGATVFLKELRSNAARAPITAEARERLSRSFYIKTGRQGPALVAGVGMHKLPRGRVSKRGKPDTADDPKVWQLWLEKGTQDRFRRVGLVGGRRVSLTRRERQGTGAAGRMPAFPVARPALSVADQAVDAVTDYLSTRIDKELAKR